MAFNIPKEEQEKSSRNLFDVTDVNKMDNNKGLRLSIDESKMKREKTVKRDLRKDEYGNILGLQDSSIGKGLGPMFITSERKKDTGKDKK